MLKYLLVVLLFIIIYPFLRIFIIRLWFYFRLILCRNIKVIKMRPFLFYGFNKGKQVDLIVISGDKIYAIKLFSPIKKLSKIIIRQPNLFTVEKFHFRDGSSFSSMAINYSSDKIVKQLSVDIFDYPELSCVVSTWLFLPHGLGVVHENIYDYKRDGEVVFGNKIFLTTKGIIKELSSNGPCKLSKSKIKSLKKQLKSK